jgi:hypothetical protein
MRGLAQVRKLHLGMASTSKERQRAMMNLHAHGSTTYDLQLAPTPHFARKRTADVADLDGELPIGPVSMLLGVLVWIVIPVAFWGGIAVWVLAR